MKTLLLLLGTASISCLAPACRPAAKAPATGFRITILSSSTGPDACDALLAIHTTAAGSLSVDQDGGHTSIVLPDPDESGSRSGSVLLTGGRTVPAGEGGARIDTLIRVQTTPGNHGGGPASHTAPRDAALADHFRITARAGDYPLDTPVEIASLRGKPVTLTVGRPTK